MKKRLIGLVMTSILSLSMAMPVCAEEMLNYQMDDVIVDKYGNEENTIGSFIEEIDTGIYDDIDIDVVNNQEADDVIRLEYIRADVVNGMPCLHFGVEWGKTFDKTGNRKYRMEMNGISVDGFFYTDDELWRKCDYIQVYAAPLKGEPVEKNVDGVFKCYIEDKLIYTLKYNVTIGEPITSRIRSVKSINSYSFVVNYDNDNYDDNNNDLEFNDVPTNAWYYKAVKFVYDKKLMNGTGNNIFKPSDPTNRAMMVTILYNAANKPEVEFDNKFADVVDGKWYSKAISWAVKNGITSGKGNGTFDINGNVTRQEVAIFLYNYAKNNGQDVSAQADLSKFSDADRVSSWAKTAVSWANAKGIINGSNGKINPTGNASRAEIATMIMNYMK